MKLILTEEQYNLLLNPLIENLQLADKIYFKTGKLSEEEKEQILNVTNGDNYTKIIADFYFNLKESSYSRYLQRTINELYQEIKSYDKNVFPIVGFDILNPSDIPSLTSALFTRKNIIEEIKKLPSVAYRNLKQDIRKERTNSQLTSYLEDLKYFLGYFSLLANRDETLKKNIYKKMFKADTTLDQLTDFVEEKENLLGGKEFTKEDLKQMSNKEDFEIIYEQGNAMIVKVDSAEGIKAIGCNSLWCFTYGSGFENAYNHWYTYSHHDMVYVIIDFNQNSDSPDFMHVLIKPLTDEDGELIEFDEDNEISIPLFNMANENYYNPYTTLNYIFSGNAETIIKTYLNFEY